MPSDFTALVRYALPGSIFFLVVALPHALSLVLPVAVRSKVFVPFQGTSAAGLSALLLGAVIAFGYLIYQVYFYFYWVMDTGRVEVDGQPIPEATAEGTSVQAAVANAKKFHEKWFIVEGRWFELLALRTGKDGVQLIAARANRLFDTYHSLGAIMAAVYMGAIAQLAVVESWPVTTQCLVWAPVLLLLWGVIRVLRENRQYAGKNIVRYQNALLRALEAAQQDKPSCSQPKRGDKDAAPNQPADHAEPDPGS